MQPTALSTPSDQLELSELAESFRAVGIENLPTGITQLSEKEQAFCLHYLRTGLWTEAARVAGYAQPEKNAAKLRKNTGIQSFLAKASQALTEETKQLIVRNEERSRSLHTLLQAELEKPEDRRSVDRIAKLSAAVSRVDSLLGALKGIGRVSGVHVSGEVAHNHAGEVALTVPATALPVLAQMRRETLTMGQTGGTN